MGGGTDNNGKWAVRDGETTSKIEDPYQQLDGTERDGRCSQTCRDTVRNVEAWGEMRGEGSTAKEKVQRGHRVTFPT